MISENPLLVSVSLRDFLAAQAMVANMTTWNSELSNEYRIKLLENWIKNFGDADVYKCIASISYEMADVMLAVRNEKNEKSK